MIKIGISACMMYPDVSRPVFGPKTLLYLEKDMANYLTINGVLPVLIPYLNNKSVFYNLLSQLDGFVFQGGTDLAPETYKETPIGKWQGDRKRDIYELSIMDYAVKNNKPVFAICRGLQLLNVYCGGTLYQDIDLQLKSNIEHRNAINYDTIAHEILFTEKSILNKLYNSGNKKLYVNTIHHQAIKDLGTGLHVLAKSKEDGIVEAIGLNNAEKPTVFGVQWHPEFSYTLDGLIIDGKPIYNYFLSLLS